MEAKTQIIVSRLTNMLVGNPRLGVEMWQTATAIDQSVREAVLVAVTTHNLLQGREGLLQIIEHLEGSETQDIQTTGKILRWSAKNYNAI